MDRRDFIKLSATGLIGLTVGDKVARAEDSFFRGSKDAKYSIVILGDTHYDTPGAEFHEGYMDPKPSRDALHRREWGRNASMWQERSPRMVKRAACLVDDDTRMVFQVGDLIQGDTGSPELHKQFLATTMDYLKEQMGPVPFLTVIGNHDMRGLNDDEEYQAYKDYMPSRLSSELGQPVDSTNFWFMIGKDAYIFIDFVRPDTEKVEQMLKETEGARYTFIVIHSPVFPYDSAKYANWIFLEDRKNPGADPAPRRHFRELFAKRHAIVICGHSHMTDFVDWEGDGGRITQITANSVWSSEELGKYEVIAEGADQFGALEAKPAMKPLFDEYRPGIRKYTHSNAAGCYKLNVSAKEVTVDFYAGDSTRVSHTFKLR